MSSILTGRPNSDNNNQSILSLVKVKKLFWGALLRKYYARVEYSSEVKQCQSWLVKVLE